MPLPSFPTRVVALVAALGLAGATGAAAQAATDRLIESQKAMLETIKALQASQTTELRNTRALAAAARDSAARTRVAVDSMRLALEADKRADSLRAQVATQQAALDSLREANAGLRTLVQKLAGDTLRLASASGVLQADRTRLADSVSKLTVAAALAGERLTQAQRERTDLLAQIQQQYQDMLLRLPEPKKKD